MFIWVCVCVGGGGGSVDKMGHFSAILKFFYLFSVSLFLYVCYSIVTCNEYCRPFAQIHYILPTVVGGGDGTAIICQATNIRTSATLIQREKKDLSKFIVAFLCTPTILFATILFAKNTNVHYNR